MINHFEALEQQDLLPDSITRNPVPPKEEHNQDPFNNEDDLHEVQVDDDLNEPDPEATETDE